MRECAQKGDKAEMFAGQAFLPVRHGCFPASLDPFPPPRSRPIGSPCSCCCYGRLSKSSCSALRGGLSSIESNIRCLSTNTLKEKTPLSYIGASSSHASPVSRCRSSLILCKATTDYSGDIPSSSPKELSQYEKIIETLTTLFPLWIILGTIIGIFKPAATLNTEFLPP